MPRMLGVCQRPWCPYCRGPAGLDCADASRSKRAERAREKRAWRREEVEHVLPRVRVSVPVG
jgi:hypothetical protein